MRLTRLGIGDWLIGGACVVLLVLLFAFPWFGYHSNYVRAVGELGLTVNANGWQTFTVVGPLALVTCVLGLIAFWLQLTRPAPAPGMLTTTVLGPFALANLIVLIFKVLIFPPTLHLSVAGTGNALVGKPAAYAAVVLALLILIGVWTSFRREGVDPADAPRHIELVSLP